MNSGAIQASEIPETLVTKITNGECILFLGAGVHAPPSEGSKYKYPEELRPLLGGKLAEEMAVGCLFANKYPNEPTWDLQRVSLDYELTQGLGRNGLVNFLNKHVQEGKEPSPALEMLAALPFKIIVTTNYDNLLEKALNKFAKTPYKFVYDPDPPANGRTPDLTTTDPTEDRPMLFKMHGDLDKRNTIVITDEDYINFVQRMSDKEALHPVPFTIRYHMQKWPTLFIGYSLRDFNLRLLFRTLRWRVDQAEFPESFSIDKRPDQLILKIWQDQRRFITFLIEDLWEYVPKLYETVSGKEFPT